MDNPNGKRKRVPMFSAADFFSGKKDAKPVGWMSDPDEPGPVIVDRKTLESLLNDKSSGADAHSTDEETIDDNKQTRKERTYVSHR